ncbi:hypothetical protein [Bacillus horti]|uniref:Uncharacterized protein n=1 Tax=Caldalkalibacillus horti TaxID=77523 RepID=A0ABT9W0F3_9BACI|nr:hypothetical protein [Bacillus horti]MDQ0166579.1 hypothetical protein [Bacillus horti]
MNKRKVYVLLSDTGTLLTKLIGLFTGYPLNHASIAFDDELREVYSFGRKRPNNPFIGGFVKEDIRSELFRNAPCEVYCFLVSDEEYNRMIQIVKQFESQQHKYKYNFIGLFGILFNRKIERKYAFFCSQFVATVISQSGVQVVDKAPNFVKPNDFTESAQLHKIYQGELCEYKSK